MFRLVPTCKGRHASKFLHLHRVCCKLFSAATNTSRFPSDGFADENTNSDINLLFESCTKVHHAKQLHAFLVVSGKAGSKFLAARLVNSYAYLGDVSFSDPIPRKDVYTWNSMVSAYVRSGRYSEAVDCFYEFLLTSGLRPDFYTFPPVLKACKNYVDGKKIHYFFVKLGFEWDVFVAASLVHMYSRFGLIDVAHRLFDEMPTRDMGSWNTVISGFCQTGNAAGALDVLTEKWDLSVTVASLLTACAQSNNILNVWGNAQRFFDQLDVRDLVSWNSIIAANEQNGDPIAALGLFNKMQLVGVHPDFLTLVSLASILAQLSDSEKSRSLHGFIIRKDLFVKDVVIGNAVVDMYAKLVL